MKLNWIAKLVIGKDVVELIYDYIRFKDEKSEGGRKFTDSEKKHLEGILIRIGRSLLSRLMKIEREKK